MEGKQSRFSRSAMRRGHRILPGESITAETSTDEAPRANGIISVSAVGSLKEDLRPGEFSSPTNSWTHQGRISTFFGDGLVAHVTS